MAKVKKTEKFSLKDLIGSVKWLDLTALSKKASRLGDDEMSVAVVATNESEPQKANQLRFRFGEAILEKMKWHPGDKLSLLVDPDDLLSFIIVKCETGSGRKLTKESKTNVCRLWVRWDNELSLPPMNQRVITYTSYQKYLHIRIPSE